VARSRRPTYPAKPITIVVPYPAGGSNDTFARQVAKELGDEPQAAGDHRQPSGRERQHRHGDRSRVRRA
jgi:hypothetical protein